MAGNNKVEERIEFIVEQQAQFTVSIQRLEEAQANADKRMTRIEGIMVTFYEDTGTKINALIDAQLRTDQKLAETDDRLNIFIEWSSALSRTVVNLRRPQHGNRVSPLQRNNLSDSKLLSQIATSSHAVIVTDRPSHE